jgi:hypothetical protein
MEDLARRSGAARLSLDEEEIRAALDLSAPRTYSDAIRALYARYAQRQGKRRYGDKTPIYVLHVAFLAGLFPEAKFVHVIRDGRDVALSYLDASWGPDTVEKAAWYWKRAVRRGRRDGGEIGPARYMEVRYEHLLEDTQAHVRAVCAFIGIDFTPSMLRYYENADALLSGIPPAQVEHQNLRRPPTKGLRDWRHQMSRRDIAVFESIAGDLLSDLGYETVFTRPSLPIRARARIGWTAVHAERAARAGTKLVRHRMRKPARRSVTAAAP